MNTLRSIALRAALTLCLAVLGGCGSSQPEAEHSEEGREETRTIRNTESIGYSGDAIADKVDSALDANDDRMKRLEEEEAQNY